MKTTLGCILLLTAFIVMNLQMKVTPARPGVSLIQSTRQRVLDAIKELYPQVSGTPDKPHVVVPGSDVDLKIQKELLNFANVSDDAKHIVISTLVEWLEIAGNQDAFYYSAVWNTACSVLGSLKATEGIDIMARHLDLQHGPITLSYSGFPAVQGLIMLGELAVPALEKTLLTDSKGSFRSLAAFALGVIGGERAVDALKKSYETEAEQEIRKQIESQLDAIKRNTRQKPLQ